MKIRLFVTVFLLALVMVFAVQNAAVVELRFLLWEVALPRSLLIFMMLFIGIMIGWFTRAMFRMIRVRD